MEEVGGLYMYSSWLGQSGHSPYRERIRVKTPSCYTSADVANDSILQERTGFSVEEKRTSDMKSLQEKLMQRTTDS